MDYPPLNLIALLALLCGCVALAEGSVNGAVMFAFIGAAFSGIVLIHAFFKGTDQ
jgi:hypothetical protein